MDYKKKQILYWSTELLNEFIRLTNHNKIYNSGVFIDRMKCSTQWIILFYLKNGSLRPSRKSLQCHLKLFVQSVPVCYESRCFIIKMKNRVRCSLGFNTWTTFVSFIYWRFAGCSKANLCYYFCSRHHSISFNGFSKFIFKFRFGKFENMVQEKPLNKK